MTIPSNRDDVHTFSEDERRTILEDIRRQNQNRRSPPIQFGFKVLIYFTILFALLFALYSAMSQSSHF